MNNPEKYYTKNIEKLYGHKRQIEKDIYLLTENKQHYNPFHINDRIDLTHLNVYSIDPENCEDVDDAFSYYQKDNHQYIVIHIADPTHYISKDSILFKDIIEKSFTKYPSNTKPIHLMPDEILNLSSLHQNIYGNVKNAISIIIEFDKNNQIDYNNILIYFSKIKVDIQNKLSYNNIPKNNHEILKCLELSDYIFPNLTYHNDNQLEIKYYNNIPHFYHNHKNELEYKKMIAKFAILSNNYVGYLLKKHLSNKHIIFRHCNNNNQELNNIDNFKDFIHFLLNNDISASYNNQYSNHDLLEVKEYLHMTSPLRRTTDCIIHYLLKSIYLNIEIPFTENEIKSIIDNSNTIHKKLKKIQFKDNKFRLFQTMEYNLNHQNKKYYHIEFYISSFYKPYINIIIFKLDAYHIYISYTLKKDNIDNNLINTLDNIMNKNYNCNIYQVNCCNHYDENCLPDLDQFIFKLIK